MFANNINQPVITPQKRIMMKRTLQKLIGVSFLLCCLLVMGGCSAKQSAIRQLTSLNKELKYDSDDYTLRDWNNALGEFKQVVGKLEKCDLSSSERTEVRRMEGECVGYLVKGAGMTAVRTVFSIGNEVKAGIEGLLDAIIGGR